MRHKEIDSRAIEVPTVDVIMSAETVAEDLAVMPPQHSKSFSNYAKELAFMEEIVEVLVHESTDPSAPDPVEVGCNGRSVYFRRGIPMKIPRKFLEALARSKQTAIRTPEIVTSDGDRKTITRKSTHTTYPYSVLDDPNPRGAAWLRAINASP